MSDSTAAAQVRTGACLCKKIAFTVAGGPDDPHVCACPHCSTRGGTPFQWWVGFLTANLTWTGTGQLTWYDTYPGKTARGFCGSCGTHIAARDYDNDTLIGILATALDDRSDPALTPTNLNRIPEAAPWLAAAPAYSAG